jgi:hypothetical protein
MGTVSITLPTGETLPLAQALALSQLTKELEEEGGKTHWHFNNCGCCVSLHGSDCSYVISDDGESTFFATRGCGCDE